MISIFRCFAIVLLSILASCASQQKKHPQETVSEQAQEKDASSDTLPSQSGNTLPHSKNKNGLTLNLVRVMEGGACKDDDHGARGVFLVYANPADVERIKAEQGDAVFSDFEKEIQDFSLISFQKAVVDSDLTVDPFALDINDAQRKAANNLARNFNAHVAKSIDAFIQETGLNIDIEPLRRSFIFYTDGCEATHLHD